MTRPLSTGLLVCLAIGDEWRPVPAEWRSRVTIAWGPSVGPMRATIAKKGVRLASEDKCQEKMR